METLMESTPSVLMPLSDCRPGELVTVSGFSGDTEMQNRLEAVGIFKGRAFRVFRSSARSGAIVDSDDMRLALDRDVAGKILVRRSGHSLG